MALVDLRPQMKRRSPEQMLEHLKSFNLDLRFTAGVWFFSPFIVRWHARYGDPFTMEQILEKAAKLKRYGLVGLEAHYPNEVHQDNLDLFKKFTRDTGIRLITIVPNLFYDKEFEWGSLSSPIRRVRQMAIRRTKDTLQLNVEMNTDFAIVWPGIDGYENPFGIDFTAMNDRFSNGLAEAMDAVPGVRIAMEPKPYEPRGHIVYGTNPEGLVLAEKIEKKLKNPKNQRLLKQGHAMFTLNPEVGHVLMGYQDLPYMFAMAMEYGRLAHTHWNSQPLGNYDQDLNVGVVSPEQCEALLYVLKMHGYREYFGIDLHPERMPVERALINCMDALKTMNDRINALNHEAVLYCTNNPEKAESRGYLEALLIRARAQSTRGLSPLPKLPLASSPRARQKGSKTRQKR